jgi:hypothetical protein
VTCQNWSTQDLDQQTVFLDMSSLVSARFFLIDKTVGIPVRLQAWQVAILVVLEHIDGLCIGSHGE